MDLATYTFRKYEFIPFTVQHGYFLSLVSLLLLLVIIMFSVNL